MKQSTPLIQQYDSRPYYKPRLEKITKWSNKGLICDSLKRNLLHAAKVEKSQVWKFMKCECETCASLTEFWEHLSMDNRYDEGREEISDYLDAWEASPAINGEFNWNEVCVDEDHSDSEPIGILELFGEPPAEDEVKPEKKDNKK